MKIMQSNIKNVFKSKKVSVETMELKGYELIENLFVDSSGFGAENEPALTSNSFISRLKGLVKEHGQVYTSLTDCGQFQVYIGVFKKAGKSKAKKIGNNTYEILDGNKRIIRFHDTNIMEFEGNTVKLFNGGYFTVTTKSRLKKFLLPEYTVYQKAGQWYVKDLNTLQSIEFTEGMKVEVK